MIRKAVSKKKRRFQKEGFDLDLTYITQQIIGMGFPSESVEGMYRNPMKEVVRFLETKHRDSYKVYNLCSERNYDHTKFQNRVTHIPFDDHNAPTLEQMLRFCTDCQEWLTKDSKNIVCVHCKAGKGRTGVMICSYMIYSGEWHSAEDALNFYAAMRTYNQKGVTIPSQIRYVHYMEDMVKNGFTKNLPPPVTLRMKDIIIYTIPNIKNPLELVYSIFVGKTQIYKSKDKPQKVLKKAKGTGGLFGKKDARTNSPDKDELDQLIFKPPPMPICGDIHVSFTDGDSEVFGFWFNTSFYPDLKLELPKSEIDRANKDKKKTFKPEFRIETSFEQVDNTVSPILKIPKRSGSSSNLSTSATSSPSQTPKRKATHIIPLDLSDPMRKQSQEQKILNKSAICKNSQKTAIQVAENCLTAMLQMKKAHSIQEISKLPEWAEFETTTSELQKVVTANLSHEESLAFWINLWNVFALHHAVLHGAPKSLGEYLALDTKYEVGTCLYTLPQIEFSILKHSMCSPVFSSPQKLPDKFEPSEPQHNNAILKSEPRVHFVLSHGTISSPGIRIYHPESIFEELEAATRAYLLTNVTQDKDKKALLFPEHLHWASADFSKTPEKILKVLYEYLPEPHQKLVKGENYQARFKEFNWSPLK